MVDELQNRRMQLHDLFLEMSFVKDNESVEPHVYFQSPNGLQMQYPAIVYNLNEMDTKFADNMPYGNVVGYSVTVIDEDSDSSLLKQVAALPMCRFNRFFASDNLNHYVFTLFF
jgi:hypothetical protein